MKKLWALTFTFLFLLFACNSGPESDESKIKKTCINFLKGRLALKKGDSALLKSVTEDSLFRLIKLNQQYVDIVSAPVIEADLNIEPKTVEIKGNTATCLMSGYEFYKIHLLKDKNQWKVVGENEIYATPDRIASSRKKLKDYTKFLKNKPAIDSVLRVVTSFHEAVKVYFKNGDANTLKKMCDDDSVYFIQHFCAYAKKRTGVKTLTEEMEKPNFMVGDVEFEKNLIYFKFYNENIFIQFKKANNTYKIIGFNGVESRHLSPVGIKEDYTDYLRALKLIRSEQYRNKEIN